MGIGGFHATLKVVTRPKSWKLFKVLQPCSIKLWKLNSDKKLSCEEQLKLNKTCDPVLVVTQFSTHDGKVEGSIHGVTCVTFPE